MRYYEIRFYDDEWGNFDPKKSYSTFNNDGSHNKGALHIDFDFPIAGYHDVGGPAYLRIFGVDLQTITSQNALKYKNIEIRGGMSKGLPFANPDQAGVLLRSQIWLSWGVWQGREQYLHMQLVNSATANAVLNGITWKCKKNSPVGPSIEDSLNHAGYRNFDINITDQFILSEDYTGIYKNLNEFSADLFDLSKNKVKIPDYLGVVISGDKDNLSISDNTKKRSKIGSYDNPIKIDYLDLINQPSWIDFATVQIQTVMRADIGMGDYVKLPEAQQIFTEKSAYINGRAALSGIYMVTSHRHIGAFREKHADSWVTVFNLIPMSKAA